MKLATFIYNVRREGGGRVKKCCQFADKPYTFCGHKREEGLNNFNNLWMSYMEAPLSSAANARNGLQPICDRARMKMRRPAI